MIKKRIFKSEIKKVLLAYIYKGAIKPGERLALPSIAKYLGVSVTPVREALTELSQASVVTYIPNRGFFLADLTIDEAVEIYEIIALLESAAILKSKFTTKQIVDLAECNFKLINTENIIETLDCDRSFHEILIGSYSNRLVLKTIESLRVRISLYEYAFWSDQQKDASFKMHQQIITSLQNENLQSAAKMVEKNWQISIENILKNMIKK